MKPCKVRLLVRIVVIGLLVVSMGSREAIGQKAPDKIRVSYPPDFIIGVLDFLKAVEPYLKEFNIQVESIPVRGGADNATAVAAGRAEFSIGSISPVVNVALQQGPLKIINVFAFEDRDHRTGTVVVARKEIKDWKGLKGKVHTCSDGLLKRCIALAKERGIGMHTHFLESRIESVQRSANGETVVERACRLGLFEVSISLAHAIHISDEELDELASRNAKVVHNPCSNLKLGSGFAKIREMLARGIVVGLGSDGGDTSDGYSLFDQMKMAAVMRRCNQPDFSAWISSAEAFAMATLGGAESLGVRSGKIERDYLADICILKPSVRMWPHADVIQALVYAENGSSVDTVLIGGEVVLKNGASTRFKESDLQKRVQDVDEKVKLAKVAWENQKQSQDFKDRSRAVAQEYQEAVKNCT